MARLLVNDRSLKFFDGEKNQGEEVHVLLVSQSQCYLEQLQQCLYEAKQGLGSQRLYGLQIQIANSIQDVLMQQSDQFTVDFIIFIIDPSNNYILKEVEVNLIMLNPLYGRDRICLLNPNPSYSTTIKQDVLFRFAQHHQFNIVNEHLMTQNSEEQMRMSTRILNLIELSCGVARGIPFIGLV